MSSKGTQFAVLGSDPEVMREVFALAGPGFSSAPGVEPPSSLSAVDRTSKYCSQPCGAWARDICAQERLGLMLLAQLWNDVETPPEPRSSSTATTVREVGGHVDGIPAVLGGTAVRRLSRRSGQPGWAPKESANASVIEKFPAPPTSRPPELRRRLSADRVGDDAGTDAPRQTGGKQAPLLPSW